MMAEKMMEEKWDKTEKDPQSGKHIVRVKDDIDYYIPQALEKEIEADNEIHFF
jgi:hypothetical protein